MYEYTQLHGSTLKPVKVNTHTVKSTLSSLRQRGGSVPVPVTLVAGLLPVTPVKWELRLRGA